MTTVAPAGAAPDSQQLRAAIGRLEQRRYTCSVAGPDAYMVLAPDNTPMGTLRGADLLRLARQAALSDADAADRARAAAPVTAWQPGPDAHGVYRRPPGTPERQAVAPHTLIDGRWQPRQAMDDAKLAELAASVAEHGVIEDLIAVVNEAGQLELITGHRRKAAAMRAGVAAVPVRVVETTATEARALAILSNDDREDLTHVERGLAYETIIRAEGISEAELARRLGRPRSYIQQHRQVAGAAPAVAQALSAGEISFTQARGICSGAGGDADAQQHALTKIRSEAQWRTATEADARGYAERHVQTRAEQALKALGWQIASIYTGGKPHKLVAGGSERPAEWTAAQLLDAVAQQRRPADGAAPAARALGKAAASTLRRRGWDAHTTAFPGWLILERAGKITALHPDELAPIVASAQRDLAAITDRLAARGWRMTWESDTWWKATSPQGRTIDDYTYGKLEALVKQIEAGKVDAAPPPPKEHCTACGAAFYSYHDWTWHGQGKLCAGCLAAARAAEADARAQIRATLATAWLPHVPSAILRALALGHQHTDRVLSGQRQNDAWVAAALDQLARPQIEAALLQAIAWSIWEQRNAPDDDGPDSDAAADDAPALPLPAPIAAADDTAAPLPNDAPAFDQIAAAVTAFERRQGHAQSAAELQTQLDCLAQLADDLDWLADDETVDTAAFEGLSRRMSDLTRAIYALLEESPSTAIAAAVDQGTRPVHIAEPLLYDAERWETL